MKGATVTLTADHPLNNEGGGGGEAPRKKRDCKC